MSVIYGERKRNRKKMLTYALVVIITVLFAAAVLHAVKQEPEEIAAVKAEQMLGALELLSIEYTEAIEEGKIVKQSEYQVSKDIAGRIMEIFQQVKPYAAQVNPQATAVIEEDLKKLEYMIEEKAPPEEIDRIIQRLSDNLKVFKK